MLQKIFLLWLFNYSFSFGAFFTVFIQFLFAKIFYNCSELVCRCTEVDLVTTYNTAFASTQYITPAVTCRTADLQHRPKSLSHSFSAQLLARSVPRIFNYTVMQTQHFRLVSIINIQRFKPLNDRRTSSATHTAHWLCFLILSGKVQWFVAV